jgi:hypothetical protein
MTAVMNDIKLQCIVIIRQNDAIYGWGSWIGTKKAPVGEARRIDCPRFYQRARVITTAALSTIAVSDEPALGESIEGAMENEGWIFY